MYGMHLYFHKIHRNRDRVVDNFHHDMVEACMVVRTLHARCMEVLHKEAVAHHNNRARYKAGDTPPCHVLPWDKVFLDGPLLHILCTK